MPPGLSCRRAEGVWAAPCHRRGSPGAGAAGSGKENDLAVHPTPQRGGERAIFLLSAINPFINTSLSAEDTALMFMQCNDR